MIGLTTLLITAVAICGLVVYQFSVRLVNDANRRHTSELAYTIAATLSRAGNATPADFQRSISRLQSVADIRFAGLTDINGKTVAISANDPGTWQDYMGSQPALSNADLDVVRTVLLHHKPYNVTTVPFFAEKTDGRNSSLVGRIYLATSSESSDAALHFIQGAILLTCMAVVLISVPIAAMIARHITIPIRKLADAAHRFADGTLTEPVSIRRTDELGELVRAFNRMTRTVQTQQADIRRINAGLETAVQARTQELQRVNQRLTSEISEKEDFLRAVSHDLNAPLRNIAGMASMLLLKYQSTLDADAVQRLQRIQKNVEAESELLNELLELSRIKTRREKIERVDLHALIQLLTEQFSSDLESRGITLNLEGRLPIMTGERMRLRQAFQNLIDNAIKYMREDGPKQITIASRIEEQDRVFSVADTGMGIPPEDMPHLFHVFRRAKNATVAKIPGKGVGLASVKCIVDNYGGRMWADSTQGQGTTFHVAIPLSCFPPAHVKQEVAA